MSRNTCFCSEASVVVDDICTTCGKHYFNWEKPTAVLLGRWQPFHDGHKMLFERALKEHGQVIIQVKQMKKDERNPYDFKQVAHFIEEKLKDYRGYYCIQKVPYIVDFVFGRDVGHTMTYMDLPPEIQAISATKIRAETDFTKKTLWERLLWERLLWQSYRFCGLKQKKLKK